MFANEIPRHSTLSGFIVNDSYGLLVSKSQINKITIIINVIIDINRNIEFEFFSLNIQAK